jgi:glycosyltransferase involved in cell wall biosynthesis
MSTRPLRIAWIGAGPGPRESGGVPGVAADLLLGLTGLGHTIECYMPGVEHALPQRIAARENLHFTWGTATWPWNRWYNRTPLGSFLTGLLVRGIGSLRLRRELARRHAEKPYDLIYQFSNIEALAMPASLARTVPLVIHPETHIAGELRALIAERRLSLRCQSRRAFLLTVLMMSVRTVIQRRRIRAARLLICISEVFRDHLVHDYRLALERTVVIPNPVRLERFHADTLRRAIGRPPTVLVLGRISVRKGIEHVIATAKLLGERGADLQIRIVGGPSLWSDYTALLSDLPANAEFVGRIPPEEIPSELARSDVLLQASKYEPFGLTVAEALAAGVPVVATSQVGAIERVEEAVAKVLEPGDVEGFADAISALLALLRSAPDQTRAQAREEAVRLFAPERVCEQISQALVRLVHGEDDADARQP